ncbi:MAG TPA: hypothetical protein VMN56_19565 [Casimicrobiaceae bacterium]|nr:hypothetical protein [Casimicrobiaceae bacterium]
MRLAIGVFVVAVLIGWFARGQWDHASAAASSAPGISRGGVAKQSLPPDTVLSVGPGRAVAQAPRQTKLSAMRQDVNAGRNLGPIYARLASANPRTPEETWLMARLLSMCGRIAPDAPQQGSTSFKPPSAQESRSRFIDSLAADEPDRDRRIAAYDAMALDRTRCDELKDVQIARADWRRLLQDAAAAGEIKAQLDLAKEEIYDQYRAQTKTGKGGLATVTEAQIETARRAIASGDPYGIAEGVNLLTGGYANMSLRDARDQPVDLRAFQAAGNLLACDAGYACGGQSGDLLQGCALFDRCGADNLRDYTMYYSASPYRSQLIAQYEQALRGAMATNDWSAFRFHPGAASLPGAWLD